MAHQLRKVPGWSCGCTWVVLAAIIAVSAVVLGTEGLLEGQMRWILGGRGRFRPTIILVGTEARALGLGLVLIGLAFGGTALGVIAGYRLDPVKAWAGWLWRAIVGCLLVGAGCALFGLLLWAMR